MIRKEARVTLSADQVPETPRLTHSVHWKGRAAVIGAGSRQQWVARPRPRPYKRPMPP